MKQCKFTNCEKKHHAKGYCDFHYRQFKQEKRLTPIKKKIYGDICIFEGCEGKQHGRGYCNTHYQQLKRGDELHEVNIYKYGKNWELTQDNLKEVIRCDPNEGIPYWKVRTSPNPIKQSPKTCTKEGYMQICINKNSYLWHRLMFLYFYGIMPGHSEVVDHINGIKNDNRLCNLRLTTQEINNTNKGKYGVVTDQRGNWGFIGFKTREEAMEKYKEFKKVL